MDCEKFNKKNKPIHSYLKIQLHADLTLSEGSLFEPNWFFLFFIRMNRYFVFWSLLFKNHLARMTETCVESFSGIVDFSLWTMRKSLKSRNTLLGSFLFITLKTVLSFCWRLLLRWAIWPTGLLFQLEHSSPQLKYACHLEYTVWICLLTLRKWTFT